MISGLRKVRKTGNSLLEKIPDTWGLLKIKTVSYVYNGDSLNDNLKQLFESENLSDYPYISSKDINIHSTQIDYNNGLRIPKEFKKLKIAPANSSLLCIEGGSAGRKIGFTNQDVCFVNKLACFVTRNFESSKFLFYYLQAELFGNQFRNNLNGLIGGVSISNIRNFHLAFPPLSEQTQIAAFLDYQTGLIDALIEKKEKLVELLKEKRQAVINEAVTKGLNPKAKMKDSGIEWLGEVPEGWDVKRLRFLGKCQNGVSQGGEYFGSGDPFVSYGDVYKNMSLPLEVVGLANSTSSDKEVYSVLEGDIFFTRTSETTEEIGFASTCLQTILNAVFAGFLIRFRPTSNIIDKNFSKYYFRSHIPRVFFIKEMNLVTRASLSQELLKSLPVLLPSLGQQKEIGSFLDIKVNQFNTLIAGLYGVILKLKEYRQSLISEAVTGKIDVREWQKPEPLLS